MLGQFRMVVLAFWFISSHQLAPAVGQQLDVTQDPADDSASRQRGAAPREPNSWEITKRYGTGWLHKQFLLHEGLPERIKVPAVEVTVVDAEGAPVAGAEVVSHTPRHWVRIMPDMTLHPQPHGSATKTNREGKFTLPERTEPYRVLVLHDSGIADITHETLLYANGHIKLERWSRIEGIAILGGKPLANTRILVRPDYSVWSATRTLCRSVAVGAMRSRVGFASERCRLRTLALTRCDRNAIRSAGCSTTQRRSHRSTTSRLTTGGSTRSI